MSITLSNDFYCARISDVVAISVDAKMCWVANIIICIKITVLKVVLQHENISYNLCIQFAFACYNSCNLVYLWISANKSI